MGRAKVSNEAELKILRILHVVNEVLECLGNDDIEVFFHGDEKSAANIYDNWLLAANEVTDILRDLHADWPDCGEFVKDVDEYLGFYRERVGFYPAWRHFVKNYDPGNPKHDMIQKDYVLKNRKLDAQGRESLAKADAILKTL